MILYYTLCIKIRLYFPFVASTTNITALMLVLVMYFLLFSFNNPNQNNISDLRSTRSRKNLFFIGVSKLQWLTTKIFCNNKFYTFWLQAFFFTIQICLNALCVSLCFFNYHTIKNNSCCDIQSILYIIRKES